MGPARRSGEYLNDIVPEGVHHIVGEGGGVD